MFFGATMICLVLCTITIFVVLRFLSRTSILHITIRFWRSFEDLFHVYQVYKVPKFNESLQVNQIYNKVETYLTSLQAMEDSDFTNLVSGVKPNDIILRLDENQVVQDTFLSARVSWINERSSFVLRLRRKDKRRILRPYLQHVLSKAEEIEEGKKEIKLYMNLDECGNEEVVNGRWRSVAFTHPASMETVVMDVALKNKVKADVELFLKSKQLYNRLGRVWKRSYLLYGPSGTGKSSFVAAMAKFLCFDVYNIDISKVSDDSDLKTLLLQTTSRSMIVFEDFDKFLLKQKSKDEPVSLSGVLNFMDGIISCCGEERIMVFTMSGNKDQIDRAVMRPGRIDVHIEFPLCDFSAFKSLASSYLGVKEHKLFPQIEEILQSNGPSLTPAEIGEIMISNRNSATRALKSVITALQTRQAASVDPLRRNKSSCSGSGDENNEPNGVLSKESVHTTNEFRKLYGLLKMGSRRKESIDLGLPEKDGSRHGS